MRLLPVAVCLVLATAFVAPPAQAKSNLLELLAQKGVITMEEYAELKAEQKSEPTVNTDDGFKLSNRDSTTSTPPTFQVGTLQQLDYANYKDDKAALSDGSELRRSRISLAGTFLTDWQYRVEYEFAGTTSVTDAYVTYNAHKPFSLTLGQFKQPFGMEASASDKNQTFMERSLPFAFVSARAPGIGAGTSGANWSLNGGLFGEPVGNAQAGNDGYGAAVRASWAPILTDEGLVHLGAGATWRVPTEDNSTNASGPRFSTLRFRSKPESNVLAQRLVDTGEIRDVNDYTTVGLEFAAAHGAASFQSEYQATQVSRDGGSSLNFDGWYAQFAYTLTGEARPYLANRGFFDGIRPSNPFGSDGWGAFEVALRLSSIDLSDDTINGGKERNATVAFNWYLNQYLRVSANLVKVLDIEGGPMNDDKPTIFQTRLQFAY